MKLTEAITRIDEMKYNTYPREEKIAWLSELDGMVNAHILNPGDTNVSFAPYDSVADGQKELLAPAPFDNMYLYWLEAKIDYYNGEYTRYNNAINLFNTTFRAYGDACNRNRKLPPAKGFC